MFKALLGKYYVQSGNLNVVILGSDHKDAALRAVTNFPDKVLGHNINVNEWGFDSPVTSNDCFYDSNEILAELGM